MFTLHCTVKAQHRLKVNPIEEHPSSTTRLGNWYCNECTVSRHKYFIFVNEQTLLPVVISVKGLNTTAGFLDRFKQRLFKTFIFMNVHEDKFMPELLEMEDACFAKTANRSVVGSMNEIIATATFLAIHRDIDIESPAMFEHLSRIPLKANKYKRSTDVVATLLHN